MNLDDDTKHFIIHRLKWFGIYAAIAYLMFFLLPFPFDFVAAIGALILINFFRMRGMMKRYGGMGRMKDLFGSLSSRSGNQNRPLKYYCMSCGKEHNEIACPNCGSKMKRVG